MKEKIIELLKELRDLHAAKSNTYTTVEPLAGLYQKKVSECNEAIAYLESLDLSMLTGQSAAWQDVAQTLTECAPGWIRGNGNGIECAVAAIRELAGRSEPGAEPVPAGFRVSVNTMKESHRRTYVVCLDRPDRPLDAMPWDPGRITPYQSESKSRADSEAEVWREFFSSLPVQAAEDIIEFNGELYRAIGPPNDFSNWEYGDTLINSSSVKSVFRAGFKHHHLDPPWTKVEKIITPPAQPPVPSREILDAAWNAYCKTPTARDMGRSRVEAAVRTALSAAAPAPTDLGSPDDRELLELAAKAADVKITEWNREGYPVALIPGRGLWGWDPLTDDGDALRLAVKLEISVLPGMEISVARHPGFTGWISETNPGDPAAATRRAIVRTAAEMGRSQQAAKGRK